MDPDDQPPLLPPPRKQSLTFTFTSDNNNSTLKDISNFKTPKRPPKTPNHHKPNPNNNNFHSPCPQFFTATKQTPKTASSSFRQRRTSSCYHPPPSSSKFATTRNKLNALALEQSQSACKAQIKKEQSLKCLSKSLTAWLNFLFRNPKACGCDLSVSGGPEGLAVGMEPTWRNPKRCRGLTWEGDVEVADLRKGVSKTMFVPLRKSLVDICSFDDLMQRMMSYLSLDTCKEIFKTMTQVTKSIDEGRLKMKSHCPIVTDFGIKDKAVRALLCYSPIWLRIGLFAIFGGDSLLLSSDEDVSSDQEMAFLKMVIEKQFFSHNGLAKSYVYNKNVEGLYRPGYYAALGNVILKRFLLLVIILDRAKTQTSLSLKFGIDGVDGGSPLLFTTQSNIKSSRGVINDFLSSDVMHGEGNLLSHLMILGYKVSYEQCPLLEYDYTVTDLFVDLQDGMRLSRAFQLLNRNPSILEKLAIPSDTPKKKLANCRVALQYLRQAGVTLSDEEGLEITADDIAVGDKELTLSLLWNIFVHLQLPLLVNGTAIAVEVSTIRGVDDLNTIGLTPIEGLLGWIQAVCEKYNIKVDNLSSLVDGKAIWCLLDYYFRRELCCSCSRGLTDSLEVRGEESIVSNTDCTDVVHNLMLSQKLIALLGNFPEVLQVGDLLEHNGATNDRSVIILLVFLSSELIVKRNMDQLNFHKLLGCNCQTPPRRYSNAIRNTVIAAPATERETDIQMQGTIEAGKKFKAIQAWWQEMAEKNNESISKQPTFGLECFSTSKCGINIPKENAAIVIQSHFRKLRDRRNYLRMISAVHFLQTVVRAWLTVKHEYQLKKFYSAWEASEDRYKAYETFTRYCTFFADGHNFAKLKRSVLFIQHEIRKWITRRHQLRIIASDKASTTEKLNATIIIQKHIRGWIARSRYVVRVSYVGHHTSLSELQTEAAIKIQVAWKRFLVSRSLHKQQLAATKIQSHCRRRILRMRFLALKQATITIQSDFRCLRCLRAFQQYKAVTSSATIIQSYVRGLFARHLVSRNKHLIIVVQSHCRGWLARRQFLFQRAAAMKIQSAVRGWNFQKAFHGQLHAAIIIQRFIRAHGARCRLSGASSFDEALSSGSKVRASKDLTRKMSASLKLQRWWKGVMLIKLKTKSAITIQCHIRGWIARRKTAVERQHILVIQSCWKGYLARKECKEQLQDLRLRLKKSAANVDDSKRLINRLIFALSELESMKSVSGILHTCATLDMATQHSQKCCEELVAAGAVSKLLKLIRSVSRSIPDQEVLKHALSTLRNLVRYPHLIEVLIDCQGSVQTIFWELLRNKEGFMIAAEILKKIFSCRKGLEEIHKLPALLKRLHNLVEEVRRKASIEKRKGPGNAARENIERRLREASELLKLTSKMHLFAE
ncbi:hypothetical protein ACFE04_002085 [Oxalis oulophora]